jgi:hypothetical protein
MIGLELLSAAGATAGKEKLKQTAVSFESQWLWKL